MGFVVEVAGRGTRAVNLVLAELLGARSVRPANGSLMISVVDQSALVALVSRLNDLGLAILRVERDDRNTTPGKEGTGP